LISKLGTKLDAFKSPLSWLNYGVDAYLIAVYSDKSVHLKLTQFDTVEWLTQFSTTRPNRKGQKFRKGFLEIFYELCKDERT